MPLDQLLVFLSLTVVVSASPGPVMLAAMANGGAYGVRSSMWGMAGATAGNLLLIVLSALGLSLILKNSHSVFRVLQWAGAAYLIWLGIKMALQPLKERLTATQATAASGRLLFAQSLGIALSNPKGLIYFGAFFPQFLSLERPLVPQYAVLVGLFVAIDLIWMLAYAKGGSFIASWLRSPRHQQWFSRVTGSALVCTGVLMVLVKV